MKLSYTGPPNLFTFLKSMLVTLGLLYFHINFIMSINSSQNYPDALIEITLYLLILWVENDIVLLKGSHGIGLTNVVKYLEK